MRTIETIKKEEKFYTFDEKGVNSYIYYRKWLMNYILTKNGVHCYLERNSLSVILENSFDTFEEAEKAFKQSIIEKYNLVIQSDKNLLTNAMSIGFIDALFLCQKTIEPHRAEQYFELCDTLGIKGTYYNEIKSFYENNK